jgi:hypothetical protein
VTGSVVVSRMELSNRISATKNRDRHHDRRARARDLARCLRAGSGRYFSSGTRERDGMTARRMGDFSRTTTPSLIVERATHLMR